ncbi:MAG: methionine adenosyltransferase domain-containing protein [Candidatus Nomurabacteria bacterium]|nr:methionine adenosyltransferase domain-containing protein [Candidatus Nomurabacteria bacterium]
MSIKTAEFVSPKHPDKICDFIADSILDAYLVEDKDTRAGIEVTGGHNLLTVNGEVTSKANPDLESVIRKIIGKNCKININLTKQSPEIAQGVDTGGAGDQGIMKGYATAETKNMMPKEYELARNLCMKVYEKYPYDGKTQVTIDGDKIKTVVVSFQNTKNTDLLPLVKSIIKADEYLINPAGEWSIGSCDANGLCNFEADSGLSGRKLVVDNYGPQMSIGGGSFSGKDCTKVDRSGAYIARKIAVDYVKNGKAKEVFVKLAYAIGKPEPVMAVAILDGKEIKIEGYDLTPRGIKKMLNLENIKFAETAKWGHFGRGFNWDK